MSQCALYMIWARSVSLIFHHRRDVNCASIALMLQLMLYRQLASMATAAG